MAEDAIRLKDWLLCVAVAMFLSGDTLLRKFFDNIARAFMALSPYRKAFTGLALLAIPTFLSVAFAEQAASVLNPQEPIYWFTAAAIISIVFFYIWEELVELSSMHRRTFILVVGVLLIAFYKHEIRWVMIAADEAARANEVREAREAFTEALQLKLYQAVTAKQPAKKEPSPLLASQSPHKGKMTGGEIGRESSNPNVVGGSLSSPDEPSERAALRMVAAKAAIKGVMFEVTLYAQNVGKYIALPPSFVRISIKASPPLLTPADEDKLFDAAPFQKNRPKTTSADAPNWQRGGIVALQPWYPGDIKSFTLSELAALPDVKGRSSSEIDRELAETSAAIESGDRGWYVMTRTLFFDKFGTIPYRDSCTFYSAKVPNGEKCLKHND